MLSAKIYFDVEHLNTHIRYIRPFMTVMESN